MRMEIRTLRAFVEVVKQGGFSQAAKVVFATQSTVSKAVKQLENEFGVLLLDRVGHRSTLTAAGEIVYRRALRILAERDDLMSELDEVRGLKRGSLRLGLPPMVSSILFAPLLAIYRKRYPGIDIRLVENGIDRLEEILSSGDIDFAASTIPVAEGLEWQSVRREPVVALLPAHEFAARKKTIDLIDLKQTPFILFNPGFAISRLVTVACRRAGFEPTVATRSSQLDFIMELVAAGMGIAFVPKMVAEQRRRPGLRSLLVNPKIDWHVGMTWRRGAYLSHAAKAWLTLVREQHDG
jgi:DNA-binding transcriptional LysR family regulator